MANVVGLQLTVGQVPHLEAKNRKTTSHLWEYKNHHIKAIWVAPSNTKRIISEVIHCRLSNY